MKEGFNMKYFELGNKFYTRKNYSFALFCYRKDLKDTSDRYTTLYNIGLTYIALKNYPMAYKIYKIILIENLTTSNEELFNCLYKLGFICIKLGMHGKSRQYLTRALCLDNNHEECQKKVDTVDRKIFSKILCG